MLSEFDYEDFKDIERPKTPIGSGARFHRLKKQLSTLPLEAPEDIIREHIKAEAEFQKLKDGFELLFAYVQKLKSENEKIAQHAALDGHRARQSDYAKRARQPRRNPKLDAYVQTMTNADFSPREILRELELMESKDLLKAIGQSKAPSLSTIKVAKGRTLEQVEQQIKPTTLVDGFICDSCGCPHQLQRQRVLSRNGAPVGRYCTDCFFTVVDHHGRGRRTT